MYTHTHTQTPSWTTQEKWKSVHFLCAILRVPPIAPSLAWATGLAPHCPLSHWALLFPSPTAQKSPSPTLLIPNPLCPISPLSMALGPAQASSSLLGPQPPCIPLIGPESFYTQSCPCPSLLTALLGPPTPWGKAPGTQGCGSLWPYLPDFLSRI